MKDFLRIIILTGCLFAGAGAFAAELLFDLKNAILDEPSGKMKLLKQEGVNSVADVFHFEGKAPGIWLQLPKGRILRSLTFVVHVKFDALPSTLYALVSRPGFHNILALQKDGTFSFVL